MQLVSHGRENNVLPVEPRNLSSKKSYPGFFGKSKSKGDLLKEAAAAAMAAAAVPEEEAEPAAGGDVLPPFDPSAPEGEDSIAAPIGDADEEMMATIELEGDAGAAAEESSLSPKDKKAAAKAEKEAAKAAAKAEKEAAKNKGKGKEEAVERARQEAEEKAKKDAEQKAKREVEEKAKEEKAKAAKAKAPKSAAVPKKSSDRERKVRPPRPREPSAAAHLPCVAHRVPSHAGNGPQE